MDNSEITLKEMNDGLLTILKCPNCSDFMVPSIYMCRNGDITCTTCWSKLSWCPACTNRGFIEEFVGLNYAMEKVAELVIYPCKYASAGCDVKLRVKDKLKHERNECLLRPLPCLISRCKLKVSRPDYLHHLNNTHLDSLIVGTDKVVRVSTHKKSESEWVFFAFERFFLFKFTTTSTELQWTMFYEGSREGASHFHFTFSTKDPKDSYPSIQFSAKPISIEFVDDSSHQYMVRFNVPQRYCNLTDLNCMEIKVHKLP